MPINNAINMQVTQHDVLVGGANNTVTSVSPSTAGFVLTSNGVSSDPSFQAAGSGTFYSITPYIVGSDVNSQYSTIQAAINQAVTDGASSSTPKNIYIKPGTYTETLTGNDGIRLIGLSISSPDILGTPTNLSVIWDGELTWSSGQIVMENISMKYSGSSTVITLPGSAKFSAIGCQMIGSTGTYIATSGDNSSFVLNNCYVNVTTLFNSTNSNISGNIEGGFILGTLTATGASYNFNNHSFGGTVIVAAGGSSTGGASFTNCIITSAPAFDASAAIFTSAVAFNNCFMNVSGTLILQQFGSFQLTGCNGNVNTLIDTSSHVSGSAPGGTVFNCAIVEAAVSTLGDSVTMSLINCMGINPPTLVGAAAVQYLNTQSGNNSQNVSTIINNQAVSTFASDGFLYVPSCTGTPMGTPTTYGSAVPIIMDTSGNQLYAYTSGSWQVI